MGRSGMGVRRRGKGRRSGADDTVQCSAEHTRDEHARHQFAVVQRLEAAEKLPQRSLAACQCDGSVVACRDGQVAQQRIVLVHQHV